MTGVQKLLLLPAPGAKPPAPSDAASPATAAQQGVEAVVKTPAVRARNEQEQGALQRRWEDQEAAAQRGTSQAAQNPAKGRQISFSRLSSMPFMVQVLGQQSLAAQGTQQAAQNSPLSQHRDGPLMGSEIYRKAGGEPELLPEDATFVRFAV